MDLNKFSDAVISAQVGCKVQNTIGTPQTTIKAFQLIVEISNAVVAPIGLDLFQ